MNTNTIYLIEVLDENPNRGYKSMNLGFLSGEEASIYVNKLNNKDIYSYSPKYRYSPVHIFEEATKVLKKNF